MPASSTAQRNTANMARAVKSGSLTMTDVPAGARAAVKSMMAMSDKQLEDFSHLKKGRTAVTGG